MSRRLGTISGIYRGQGTVQNALESSSHSFHPATLQERHYYSPFLEGEPEVQKGEMNSLRFLSTSVAEGGSISFSACRTRSQHRGVRASCPPPLPPSHQPCSFRHHPRYLDPALPDLAPSAALELQGNTHRCTASRLPTPPRTSAGLRHSFMDSTAQRPSNE